MMHEDELQDPKPCVINENLLQIGIREGLTDAERERLDESKKPGNETPSTLSLSPPDINVLRLNFMHIRKIDNLQCYTGLKELYLANNCITKIENLACLANLTKLDLSFNLIADVDEKDQPFNPFEGLECLNNLEELSLFKNRITRLENFPNLPKLRYLSLGRNKISELNEIPHLYKLKSLRILTIVGNPIADKDICKLTVLAYLQNLHFLDYTRVTAADVQDARERHSDQLNQLQQTEDLEKVQRDNEKAQEARAKVYREAFVHKIYDLNVSLFKKDSEHAKLRSVAELAEPYMRFADDLKKTVDAFIDDMLAQSKLLSEEEEQFNTAYNKVTEENRLEMVQMIKRLERKRRKFIESINPEEEQQNEPLPDGEQDPEDESAKFMQEINDAEDELLTTEFALVDMVSEMIRLYETELEERINAIAEKITVFFGNIRNLNSDYNERVSEVCLRLWERLNQGETLEISEEIRGILVDKDALASTIQTSHEYRNTKIYKREESITTSYKQKGDQMIATARQNDLERNRKRIAEISKYIQNTIEVIHSFDDGDDEEE